MAILSDESLKADNCKEMVISMWFRIPELPEHTTDDERPTDESDEHDSRVHEYLLMEFGGYDQTPERRWYPVSWTLAASVTYGEIIPYHDPDKVEFRDGSLSPFYSGEVYATGTPGGLEGQLTDPVTVAFFDTDVYHSSGGSILGATGPLIGGPIAPRVYEKLGAYTLDFLNGRGWEGTGPLDGWGQLSPRAENADSDIYGIYPSSGPTSNTAEILAVKYEPFSTTYYRYQRPSYIVLRGGGFFDGIGPSAEKTFTITVNIGGSVHGPLNPRRNTAGDGLSPTAVFPSTHGPWEGETVVPRLQVEVPFDLRPFWGDAAEGRPAVGSETRPYVTIGKWHHLLVCVKLNGESMIETVDISGTETTRYLDNTMWVLLDGVAYGGMPWPTYDPDQQKPVGNAVPHEFPLVNYSFPPTFPSHSSDPLTDRSFDRSGIVVKEKPLHIPYNPKWERISDEYTTTIDADILIFGGDRHFEQYTAQATLGGWKPLDQTKQIPYPLVVGSAGNSPAEANVVLDARPFPAFQQQILSDFSLDEAKTEDIKREYSDVQVWFGKFVDPTDYKNLKLFLDITRNDEGKLVGNIPKLDQDALDSYANAQVDDPTIKVLSLAAAPINLDKPDVYLAGGASSFIHDRGKEGDVFVKIGTIKDTPKPVDIPIPESAVKPIGL